MTDFSDLSNGSDWVKHLSERLAVLQPDIPAPVRLIAVTKTFPAAAVAAAYQLGLRDFGESKIQEAAQKRQQLSDLKDVTWHLIGHLQTNKARKALQLFDWIHSVDSLKLAQKLNQAAGERPHPPRCCLQVKIVPDPDKYGFEPDQLIAALPQLDQLDHLKILGLMTILPLGLTPTETQSAFTKVQILADHINKIGLSRIQIDYLSMGMSEDFRSAIAAGATFIRLGTTLFGHRQ
ncbi:MAG: YggS family pyridoxal phosphate-dependent enzyme [Cyanobacteria bacterium P01_A01_bin.105]